MTIQNNEFEGQLSLLCKIMEMSVINNLFSLSEAEYLLDYIIFQMFQLESQIPKKYLKILSDLKYDLSFYEPDTNMQKEVSGLLDDKEFKEKIAIYYKEILNVIDKEKNELADNNLKLQPIK